MTTPPTQKPIPPQGARVRHVPTDRRGIFCAVCYAGGVRSWVVRCTDDGNAFMFYPESEWEVLT